MQNGSIVFHHEGLEGGHQSSPLIFNKISCNGLSSTLFECIDLSNIGVFDCGVKNYTAAGVICEEKTLSDSVSYKIIMSLSCQYMEDES